jgi:hypothetical protein
MVGTAVRKIFLSTATAAVLVLGLAACSQTPSTTPTPAPSTSTIVQVTTTPSPTATASASATPSASITALGPLTGSWKGTWLNESPQPGTGTFTLSWAQQGTTLIGAIGVLGSTCLTAGNVTGTVNGNQLSFGAVEGNNMINYSGTVNGNTMSGTYISACGNSKGTWNAVKNQS